MRDYIKAYKSWLNPKKKEKKMCKRKKTEIKKDGFMADVYNSFEKPKMGYPYWLSANILGN